MPTNSDCNNLQAALDFGDLPEGQPLCGGPECEGGCAECDRLGDYEREDAATASQANRAIANKRQHGRFTKVSASYYGAIGGALVSSRGRAYMSNLGKRGNAKKAEMRAAKVRSEATTLVPSPPEGFLFDDQDSGI